MIGEERFVTTLQNHSAKSVGKTEVYELEWERYSSRKGLPSVACAYLLYKKSQTYRNLCRGKEICRREPLFNDKFPEEYYQSSLRVRMLCFQGLTEIPLADAKAWGEPFLRGVFSPTWRAFGSESLRKSLEGVIQIIWFFFTHLHGRLFLSLIDTVSVRKTSPRCAETHAAY